MLLHNIIHNGLDLRKGTFNGKQQRRTAMGITGVLLGTTIVLAMPARSKAWAAQALLKMKTAFVS